MEKHLLVVDLEATCCDQGSVPREEMEIIEIGAVMLEPTGFEVVGEFGEFVKPVRHPELTLFCRTLTNIPQDGVSHAEGFATVLNKLISWSGRFPASTFCSWGDYDRNQFQQDCRFHNVAYPFGEHRNVKREFSAWLGTSRRFGLGAALRALDLTFEGSPHRGIDDARNIARVVRAMNLGERPDFADVLTGMEIQPN